MSLKGIIEFIVCLENYYIIQYPQQGLFSFRFNIYQQRKNNNKNYAIPYQLIPSNNNNQQTNNRIILDPYIKDSTVVSSTGLAKYSQQVLDLDDWIQLRLQVQAYPEIQCEHVFMQVQLRFNHNNLKQPQSLGELIQSNTFKLNQIQNGMFNYYQCEFDTPYYSKLNFTLMSYITNFKFAKYEPLEQEISTFQKKRIKIHSVEQLVNLTKLQYPQQNIQRLFYTNYIKKLRISQYLIAERINNFRIDKQKNQIQVDKEFLITHNLESVKEKQEFKIYLDQFYPKDLTVSTILKELNVIRQQNFNFILRIVQLWMNYEFDHDEVKKEFDLFQRQQYGQRVFKSVIHGDDEKEQKQQMSSKQNKKIAKQIRGKDILLNSYAIEDVRIYSQKEKQEIIFYQLYFPYKSKQDKQALLKITQLQKDVIQQASKLQYSQKHMLVVLFHGFQGSSYDMLLIKRWILKQLPDAYFLISKANQDNTQGDIRKMGKKAADQIQNFINNYMQEYQQQNVIINMVGHSMGGIIARSAITHLYKYRHQFGFFCSLSSPHIGYLNGVSGLIKVGLWAIRKWKKIQSLQQLSMQQKGDPRKTFLYELSQSGHLRYFRKIILLSSFEDSYVSWHSARISCHRSKNSLSKVQQQMQQNILGNNIYGATIHRLDVNFNVKTNNLDSFIGRTAHINLIIKENLFKILNITIPKLFDLTQFGREGMFL